MMINQRFDTFIYESIVVIGGIIDFIFIYIYYPTSLVQTCIFFPRKSGSIIASVTARAASLLLILRTFCFVVVCCCCCCCEDDDDEVLSSLFISFCSILLVVLLLFLVFHFVLPLILILNLHQQSYLRIVQIVIHYNLNLENHSVSYLHLVF
jgi:hypothetical protein